MNKRLKLTIKQNLYGNWYGYENGKKVIEFFNTTSFSQEENAKNWLYEKKSKSIDYESYQDGHDPYAESTTDVMRQSWLADKLQKENKVLYRGRILQC